MQKTKGIYSMQERYIELNKLCWLILGKARKRMDSKHLRESIVTLTSRNAVPTIFDMKCITELAHELSYLYPEETKRHG